MSKTAAFFFLTVLSHFPFMRDEVAMGQLRWVDGLRSVCNNVNDSLKNPEPMDMASEIARARELEEIDLVIAEHQRSLILIAAFVASFMIGMVVYYRQQVTYEKRMRIYKQIITEKLDTIERITKELESMRNHHPRERSQVEKFNQVLQLNIFTNEDWEKFKKAFEEVHPGFFAVMRFRYPDMTPSELRLSALLKMKLSLKESASRLGISLESVKKARYRLKKKLGLTDEDSIEEFIERLPKK